MEKGKSLSPQQPPPHQAQPPKARTSPPPQTQTTPCSPLTPSSHPPHTPPNPTPHTADKSLLEQMMMLDIFTSNFTGGLAPASNQTFQGIYLYSWLARGKISERKVILNFQTLPDKPMFIFHFSGSLRIRFGKNHRLFFFYLEKILKLLNP